VTVQRDFGAGPSVRDRDISASGVDLTASRRLGYGLGNEYRLHLQEFDEMNRHQRRAAQRQQAHGSAESETPVNVPTDLNALRITLPDDLAMPSGTLQAEDIVPAKPSLVIRALAKILLSPWVLARVQHPDVERLLISFAVQTNRIDVVDELTRRQAMRSSALF
jgi:hypothetical protein